MIFKLDLSSQRLSESILKNQLLLFSLLLFLYLSGPLLLITGLLLVLIDSGVISPVGICFISFILILQAFIFGKSFISRPSSCLQLTLEYVLFPPTFHSLCCAYESHPCYWLVI